MGEHLYTAGVLEDEMDPEELMASLAPFAPEVTVVDWPLRERARWKAKMRQENEARYGKIPRSSWPRGKLLPFEMAERDYWVDKLYREEGLTIENVAEKLGLHPGTISTIVARLGIGRGRNVIGKGGVKDQRKQIRRQQVRQLHENGASVLEIKAELGWSESAIRADLRDMGLPYTPPARKAGLSPEETTDLLSTTIRQLGILADVVLTARLGEIDDTVDDRQMKEWDDALSRARVATQKIRKTMRGRHDNGSNDE